ncbi:hypothetical protein K504DRAFT_410495 [Pleomassaria siparia CBS 279.74]|uniref:ubiquitinyl hydrolase 1 n=1 Tax=Pleomassaria siparia CBS 279.74 TaxID=1314801 RepID=A0A6G1K4M6_9PLEO|nr:hypothetical protein K504DRAFT_410495 [Pleomassaria siparia CBS 279.74]
MEPPRTRAARLLDIYFHVALPREVPSKETGNLYAVDAELATRLQDAVKTVSSYAPLEHQSSVDALRLALTTAKAINCDGKIDKHLLKAELRQLDAKKALILFVTEQNAALLLYRDLSKSGAYDVVFEAFETSATSEQVLAAKHALQWDFPGTAVAVPCDIYSDESFQESLAGFLEQASIESIKQFSAVTYKAAAPLPEIRDTVDPKLITGLLMTILATLGAAKSPPLLRKRVRNTVSFKEAQKPWRRSAFYLALRVSMQRHLYQLLGPDLGRLYYKTIICVFISRLLEDAYPLIAQQSTHFLRLKLGQRLSKLEVDRERATQESKNAHDELFRGLRAPFEKTLASAARFLEARWEEHKRRRTKRAIQPLPRYASPTDMCLELRHSRQHLEQILQQAQWDSHRARFYSASGLVEPHASYSTETKPFIVKADLFIALSRFEEEHVAPACQGIGLSDDAESRCIQLRQIIKSYISTMSDTYDNFPDSMSTALLRLMELWVELDRTCLSLLPLMMEYHPVIEAHMLDILQLQSLGELKRLQAVQSYISQRCRACICQASIFDPPAEGSFAIRYYDECSSSHNLTQLRRVIENDAERARAAKEEEWMTLSEQHDGLMRRIAESACVYITEYNEDGHLIQVHKKGCLKHRLKWEAKQMRIKIHEHPLPACEHGAKAALFELDPPHAFVSYRDATWQVLETFTYPKQAPVENVPMVCKYSGLVDYCSSLSFKVSLGSSTKSHLESHYATSSFPVPFEKINRPCGLKLRYFDIQSQTWMSRDEKPSFSSYFALRLPADSPFRFLGLSGEAWPSSNRIISSQTKCPPELNHHEFMAWQDLLVGTHSRWLSLLRELGSANLNFSTDSTWSVVSRLIGHVGPSSSNDTLRDTHAVFHEESFCKKLLAQVATRLEAIRRNWREPIQMDIMISILLKVHGLSSVLSARLEATKLLGQAREIAWSWHTRLQSTNNHVSQGPPIFAIWASLLCKRTLYSKIRSGSFLDTEALRCFVASSIALSNTLLGHYELLPYNLRNALLQDAVHAYSIRSRLQIAIQENIAVFLDALSDIWPVPQDGMKSTVVPQINSVTRWVEVRLTSAKGQVCIHYHLLYGTLFIDGEEMGLLPPEYHRWPEIQMLFGTQNLRYLPSPLPGMSHVANRAMPHNHWVHLGFNGDRLVIRADQRGKMLEFVDRRIFGTHLDFDLPNTLIDNCYHWLNLNTGILEIRQDDPWKSKEGNWSIDLSRRKATRRESTIVDPHSDLFRKVVSNFTYFEYAHQIMVYQPMRGPLRVELKRLELNFSVNAKGLLWCSRLGSVIVESRYQDIGTWYGLHSKIVLQSIKNGNERGQRSVLVPIGQICYKREDEHVRVFVHNEGIYMKFGIDEVLGRVECPAEPKLLYYRALWHAITSHVLPDPLTGRTGTEEAIHYLQSGSYQPWSPISTQNVKILLQIANLSPRRVYYPPNLKRMEAVYFNQDLTDTIQDDRLRGLVEQICKRLSNLSLFTNTPDQYPLQQCPSGDAHLEYRALARAYAHHSLDKESLVYHSRDRQKPSDECQNVAFVSNLLLQWPQKLRPTVQLSGMLEGFSIVGGHAREFEGFKQLTDLLNIDIVTDWGPLAQFCLDSSVQDKFRLIFLLSSISFSAEAPMVLIRALIAFALLADIKALQPPMHVSYTSFKHNEIPKAAHLVSVLKEAMTPYVPSQKVGRTQAGQMVLARLSHDKEAFQCCEQLAQSILAQWPNNTLQLDQLVDTPPNLLDRSEALGDLSGEWARLTSNYEFSQYLDQVQLILNRHIPSDPEPARKVTENGCSEVMNEYSQVYPSRLRGGEIPTLQELLQQKISNVGTSGSKNAPKPLSTLPNGITRTVTDLSIQPVDTIQRSAKAFSPPPHIKELSNIISAFRCSTSSVQKRYGDELQESITQLVHHMAEPEAVQVVFNPTHLASQIFNTKAAFRGAMDRIRIDLRKRDHRATWLRYAGWPKMTPVTLLTELRSTSHVSFGEGTKEALVDLGLKITEHQRLLRIRDAISSNKQQQLREETINTGHTNWNPLRHIDWLLLEIDSNILIRPEQVEVALATISPQSGENSVLQLLMGKGKTSTIMPMVGLELADRKQLFRIIVPRSLLLQSAQIMQTKLGGLLNRETLHIPFSRRTPTNTNTMKTYCDLHSQLQRNSGILLALPEHILSFKLSGLQRLCEGRMIEATMMIGAQNWLEKHSRDVLDESDQNLAIRTQLIYPSGSQTTVDGHPLRWQTIQSILRLIRSYLPDIQHDLPRSIEVVNRLRGYPLIYFLRQNAEEQLTTQIVREICQGQTSILPCVEVSDHVRKDLESFIASPVVKADVVSRVNELFKDRLHLMNVAYLLRGLFVHRILLSTLKKRWNVQFGLHPDRDPIAVPFLAKGVPSPSAEFGHPDVAIILTCLSFYYQGLSISQFKHAFEQLLRSNEPSIEYEKWASEDLPEGLRDCNSINVEDVAQLHELHFYVRDNVFMLDFYLNNFVFPRHAKQFKTKLQASGWDLVLYDPDRSTKCQTTGFSGTNDSRHQLPMTIRQNDLPKLKHTNAEVLAYLLENRNRRYVHAVDYTGKRLSEEGLLEKLQHPHRQSFNVAKESPIRVLIDAGAQILEHDNLGLAKLWLEIDHKASAAVYFTYDHQPWVIYRKGRRLPLIASPFADNLEDCLIYLDESHCRGTDLKLPPRARAALTLGPNLTKDALVQAAMRLRLLGQSQSVTFFSPPEVHQSILDLRKGRGHSQPDSSDVVRWLLVQSCNAIEQLEPLYFAQGTDYLQRANAKRNNSEFLQNEFYRNRYLSVLQYQELTTLKQLYEPKQLKRGKEYKAILVPNLRGYADELQERRRDFQDHGTAIHSSALEEVEQEREVENEVEDVREAQKPVHFEPRKVPRLHKDIRDFATTGYLPVRSDAFQPMFSALQKTALGSIQGSIIGSSETSRLFVSTQFTRVVVVTEANDNFLRPCQWVVWSCISGVGLIVSPEEADRLIPILRSNHRSTSRKDSVHLIVYATPVTRKMLQFNNLDYYAVPPLPTDFKIPVSFQIELGIFSGRLYFGWEEYGSILSYLGFGSKTKTGEGGRVLDGEGSVKKPLTFLHDWLAVRRKGQDFEHTPMGYITTGKPLYSDHPFFLTSIVRDKTEMESKPYDTSAVQVDEESEDEDDHDEDYFSGEEYAYGDGEESIEADSDEDENMFLDAGEYVEETKMEHEKR